MGQISMTNLIVAGSVLSDNQQPLPNASDFRTRVEPPAGPRSMQNVRSGWSRLPSSAAVRRCGMMSGHSLHVVSPRRWCSGASRTATLTASMVVCATPSSGSGSEHVRWIGAQERRNGGNSSRRCRRMRWFRLWKGHPSGATPCSLAQLQKLGSRPRTGLVRAEWRM